MIVGKKTSNQGDEKMQLECVSLKKEYGKITAIEEINYCFTPGVYGLLGPNGAGKSTWMKILTDSIRPSSGDVMWNGSTIYDDQARYIRNVGYIPQNQNIYPYFTGLRFMYYMSALKGIKKETADGQIMHLLKRVNLEEYAGRKISAYSGGMRQRLLIAQAFLGEPKVILMDEPTAGLDPKERIRIRNLISEMAIDKIVLIATHVVSDIEYISREILLMKKGMILGHGTAEELEDDISGYVYECIVHEDELEEFTKNHLVAGIRKEGNRIIVRYISEKEDADGITVRPNLDDVYLYHFREDEQYVS